jgi:hypothetical protein
VMSDCIARKMAAMKSRPSLVVMPNSNLTP